VVTYTYLGVFFGAGLVVQLTTPLVARVARAFNIIDQPAARKVHRAPVPRIGGVAIVLGTILATLPVLLMDNPVGQAFRRLNEGSNQVVALLGAALVVFLVGLLDDVRSIPAKLRLVVLVAASLVLCSSGARIESITLSGNVMIQLGWLSWPLTILWIVAITVAINFIDGLDGLAGGIAAIVCSVLAVLAFYGGHLVMGVLMLALLGSLVGFLFFNWNPAKIFMGDCGSMFLGFMIGGSSVVCQTKAQTLVGLALPALAMGVPLFDTLLTFIRRRVLNRRSIFASERGHIHHRLLDLGLGQRVSVLLMYLVTAVMAGIGVLLLFTRNNVGMLAVIGCGLAVLLLVFRVAGASRFRETIAALHRNSIIAHQVRVEREHFEDVQLQMLRATTFEEWWRTVCELASRMCFERVALIQQLPDGDTTNLYVWRRTQEELKPGELVTMAIPLIEDAMEGVSGIELTISRQWSLECVGRRVTLFGRLIDEYGLARRQAAFAPAGRTTLTVLSALGLVSRPKAAVGPVVGKRAARSSQA
jgi:UDP-GlcNAc:undecaprenyl-phosphate GlcNAc-1-phosphate transferase